MKFDESVMAAVDRLHYSVELAGMKNLHNL